MNRILLFFTLLCATASAQDRFIISVNDNDNAQLINTVLSVGNINIVRNLNFPGQQLNAVAALVDNASVNQLRNALDTQYLGNYLMALDPPINPTEGSGDSLSDPIDPSAPVSNSALDHLVPGRPITSPPSGPIQGDIIVDIVGTGIDQSHPDLAGLFFETPLSVMPATGGGFLPGDIDYHNHETRIAGCLAGSATGLLTALGTRSDLSIRSVLCYGKPATLGPAVPTTFTSDCIAALAEIIFLHEDRLNTPYLKNHGAVMSFSHSVEIPNTRVGDLDALFDLAWERGIITSISAGNFVGTAAASSPAGAGEWVIFDDGGGLADQRYWPPLGAPSFDLPSSVGFETTGDGADYHLKTGAHDNTPAPSPWDLGDGIGSALNTPNPEGLGPAMNSGVDLFAPGQDISVPATQLRAGPGGGAAGPVEADGSTYYLRQGYQTGNGTSYSAAFTTAAAARILQMRPWASPDQVRDALLASGGGAFELLTIPDLNTLDPMSLTYAAWLERYSKIAVFGYFDEGGGAKSADPDGDGVPNYIEYLCGMDPRFEDPQHAPTINFDEEAIKLSVTMQLAAYLPDPAEVTWQFQGSGNLEDWVSEGQGDIEFAPQTEDNGDGLTMTATLSIDPVETRRFFRFQITSAP